MSNHDYEIEGVRSFVINGNPPVMLTLFVVNLQTEKGIESNDRPSELHQGLKIY